MSRTTYPPVSAPLTDQFFRQHHLVGHPRRNPRCGLLPFSAATLWRKVKANTFPAPVKLSERITAWRAEEVIAWMASAGARAEGASK
jgi:prophage regulatory protein